MDNPEETFDPLTSDGFRGWHVKDPENFSGVDGMLAELDRRLQKSGRLDEYKESQRVTKPSERRREERQAHRAEENKSRDR